MPEEPAWMTDGAVVPLMNAQARRDRSAALTALCWADLMAEPDEPPPMLATGIPKVGLTVLAGPPKVGKTLYSSQTALGVGRSTMVIEEGSRDGIRWRLRRQAQALGIADPDVDLLLRQRVRLDNRASVDRLRAHISVRRPQLVIFDPLNRLHDGDENRPSQMTPVMDAMAGIAYDYGCAVLAVHHLTKPSADRPGSLWDRFRGAGSIRSGTDANLIMDGTAKVHLVGEFRDAEPLHVGDWQMTGKYGLSGYRQIPIRIAGGLAGQRALGSERVPITMTTVSATSAPRLATEQHAQSVMVGHVRRPRRESWPSLPSVIGLPSYRRRSVLGLVSPNARARERAK